MRTILVVCCAVLWEFSTGVQVRPAQQTSSCRRLPIITVHTTATFLVYISDDSPRGHRSAGPRALRRVPFGWGMA